MATNFYALGWDNIVANIPNGWQDPPDTHGAVSKDFCVTMLNTEVRIQKRTGQEILRQSRFNWWTNGHPALNDINVIADPRVVYDPFHDRWMATIFVNNDYALSKFTNAGILVAVS